MSWPARTADGLPICDCCGIAAWLTYDLRWFLEQVTTENPNRFLLKPNEALCDSCLQTVARSL